MVIHCRRDHHVLDMRHDDIHSILALVGELSGDHLIHADAERIKVGTRIRFSGPCLFGGDIVRGSDHCLTAGVSACRFGDAEIRHLDLAVSGYDDVLRLDIPVDDALPVRFRNAFGCLDGDADRFLVRELPLPRNIILQGNALH